MEAFPISKIIAEMQKNDPTACKFAIQALHRAWVHQGGPPGHRWCVRIFRRYTSQRRDKISILCWSGPRAKALWGAGGYGVWSAGI